MSRGDESAYFRERNTVAEVFMAFFDRKGIKADEIDAHELASAAIERLDRLRARMARRGRPSPPVMRDGAT